jgi:tetratricopeptide (TPR) repeat protein
MAGTLFQRIIILTAIVVTVLSGGCGKGSHTEQGTGISETPQDKEKAELMAQIDKKWESPEAHYKLGQLYQGEGLYAKAQYEYNNALSFDPAHRGAQAATISVLQAMGDKEKAAMTADTYIMQTSGSPEESLKLGLAFQKETLDDLALRCYEQAIRLAPNSAKVNRQIGYYYLSKGDKVRAREYLYRSFELNRDQADVAGELGRLGVDISGAKTESGKEVDKIVTDSDKARAGQ